MPAVEQEHFLGPLAAAVDARAELLDSQGFGARLYAGDPDLWAVGGVDREAVRARLGWLGLPASMRSVDWPRPRPGDVLLIGMGGSSLAASACAMAFGARALRVVDSTVPAAVLSVVRDIDLDGATVILASKSGTTVETTALGDWFLQAAATAGATVEPMAITDAGTPLQARIEDIGGRVWCNPVDVGGRFSALSYFGLVPAALAGVPVKSLVQRALAAAALHGMPGDPSVRLGVILAEAHAAGRNRLTLVAGARLAGFADWIEQLVAESTGKRGKGLVPVTGEQVPAAYPYGSNRLFVFVDGLDAAEDDRSRRVSDELAAAGHPVLRFTLSQPADLGAEFLRWEVAVAVAGALMRINPFDEPDVAAAKARTKRILGRVGRGGRPPELAVDRDDASACLYVAEASGSPSGGVDSLAQWLGQQCSVCMDCAASTEGYLAVLAFVPACRRIEALLEEVRTLAGDRFRLATTLGWGPRYLHSTGQLHKGGPGDGIYLVFTTDDSEELPIPRRPYTLGALARAQACGDIEALQERRRPVARVHLAAPAADALELVVEALRRGLAEM